MKKSLVFPVALWSLCLCYHACGCCCLSYVCRRCVGMWEGVCDGVVMRNWAYGGIDGCIPVSGAVCHLWLDRFLNWQTEVVTKREGYFLLYGEGHSLCFDLMDCRYLILNRKNPDIFGSSLIISLLLNKRCLELGLAVIVCNFCCVLCWHTNCLVHVTVLTNAFPALPTPVKLLSGDWLAVKPSFWLLVLSWGWGGVNQPLIWIFIP